MRVLFLGTGAAEGYPALFCEWRALYNGACARRAQSAPPLRAHGERRPPDRYRPRLLGRYARYRRELRPRLPPCSSPHAHGGPLLPAQSLHASEQLLRYDTRAVGSPLALLPRRKRRKLRPQRAISPKRSFTCGSTPSNPVIPGRPGATGVTAFPAAHAEELIPVFLCHRRG